MKINFKLILKVLIGIFVLIQFFRPKLNNSYDNTNFITNKFEVPENVMTTLKTSCFDCHSNGTVYPWYTNIQPVGWMMNNHIQEGKGELNFSEFAKYSPRRQYKKFSEIMGEVDEGKMPLSSYTLIHKDAILTKEQKDAIAQWTQACREKMKLEYPIDSLQRKKQ